MVLLLKHIIVAGHTLLSSFTFICLYAHRSPHMYLTMVYSAVSPKMIKWNNLFEIEIRTVSHIALRYEDHNRMAIQIAVIKLPQHQGEKYSRFIFNHRNRKCWTVAIVDINKTHIPCGPCCAKICQTFMQIFVCNYIFLSVLFCSRFIDGNRCKCIFFGPISIVSHF